MLGCDEAKMVDWLHDVCELREQEARKVTEGLAEKAKKLVSRRQEGRRLRCCCVLDTEALVCNQ